MRHSATRALLERDDVIIVASVSCIYGIGSVETYTAMTFQMAVGDRIDQRQLLPTWWRSSTSATRHGLRARQLPRAWRHDRAFPPTLRTRAWRISLFGDEIESISEFDPLTGQKTGDLKSVKIYANSHYVTPRPTLNQAIQVDPRGAQAPPRRARTSGRLLEAQRLEQRTRFDLEMLEATGVCATASRTTRATSHRAPARRAAADAVRIHPRQRAAVHR
jgi:excinuclease ABC subunit B